MSPAARETFPFDAVLFDLDGTLLATDRFWIPAARIGARRAFEELGLARELPSAEGWMSLVGLPLAQGFDTLFADLAPAARALVMKRCVEEEHFALESGSAALMPGVPAVLAELQELGVRMGIASNCSQAYLDSAMQKVDLHRYIAEGRCLDSRGVRDKADMIEDLLLTFGTRSAVMVGDRAGDRDAAWANGLPHVHLANGFAPRGEEVRCEARIDDFGELLPRLRGRTRWIEAALARLGLAGTGGGPRSLGITGRSGAGKSLFARDLVRALRARGRETVLVALDDFLRPDRPARSGMEAWPGDSPLELPGRVFRLDVLTAGLLEPHARGLDVSLDLELEDGAPRSLRVPGQATLVLEGLYLLHPRLRALLERVAYLDVPEELCLRRVAARELPLGGAQELERTRRRYLPAQARFDELCPPASRADLVLDALNPLGPPRDAPR
jgi:phosphoglycolate phosphatase-like HAD superfamily hydrolase/uridine kinase